MKLKTVRARQGIAWVQGGFRVFLKQPLGYSGLFALIGLAVLLLLQLPFIGPVLALGLMPIGSLAFLIATRDVLAGRSAHPALVFGPLRQPARRRALIQLGAVYAASAIAVVLLAHLLDGGRFAEAVLAIAEERATPETFNDPMLEFGLLLRLALMIVLSLAFWHTPALVYWDGLTIGKAIFASMLACWRSLGAFALYGICWFLLLVALMLLAQTIFALMGLAQAAAQAALPAVMLCSTVFYASLYFSYADAFDSGHSSSTEATGPATEPPADPSA